MKTLNQPRHDSRPRDHYVLQPGAFAKNFQLSLSIFETRP